MKDGRRAVSNLSGDSPDRQVVGRAKADHLTAGLVDALTRALREGVPVRQLPDQMLYRTGSIQVSIDTRSQQREDVRRALTTAEAHARSARTKSVKAHTAEDYEAEMDWDNERREARAEANRLRAILGDLEVPPALLPSLNSFKVMDDVWLPALSRLRSSNIMTQEERNAVEIIIPELTFEYEGGDWFGSATLRVNTSMGVAELGPIRWRCATGFTSPSSVVALPPSAVTSEGRSASLMEDLLLRTGRMTPHAAKVVIQAKAVPQLKYVLLNQLCGERFPDTVSEQWRDPILIDWLTRVYTDPQLGAGRKKPGRYMTLSVTRQFAAWLVAERGSVTQTELREAMGVTERDHSELDRPREYPGSFEGPWLPPVNVVKRGRSPDQIIYEAVLCACGRPASVVARVAENPRDLACECGLVPDGERLGLPPGLRFPPEYALLAPSKEHCLAEIRRREDPTRYPGRSSIQLLAHLAAQRKGLRQRDLSAALGGKAVSQALRVMASRGLVASESRQVGALWSITDAGRNVLAMHS